MLMEKVVRIFKSIDEADAADSIARSRMGPQERFDIFFATRERAYSNADKSAYTPTKLVDALRPSPQLTARK